MTKPLLQLLDDIEEGYAKDLTMFDPPLTEDVQDLADRGDEIREAALGVSPDIVGLLKEKGYTVEGGGLWWFTWARPDGRGDVEVGEDCTSVGAAWRTALIHFLKEATIPME